MILLRKITDSFFGIDLELKIHQKHNSHANQRSCYTVTDSGRYMDIASCEKLSLELLKGPGYIYRLRKLPLSSLPHRMSTSVARLLKAQMKD